MPIYDFRCDGCGDEFDAYLRKPSSDNPKCPGCGCMSKRLVSSHGSFKIDGLPQARIWTDRDGRKRRK